MKNLIFVLLSLTFIISCNSGQNNNQSNFNDNGIEIGTLGKGNPEEANLSISIDKAIGLTVTDNRLTEDFFEYKYKNPHIEVIKIGNNSYKYFLALEADLTPKMNTMAYSCYSIFTELQANNYSLFYNPGATQHSLRGKCCNHCKLVFENGQLNTECGEASQNENCMGSGRCSITTSKAISKEQVKDDMI